MRVASSSVCVFHYPDHQVLGSCGRRPFSSRMVLAMNDIIEFEVVDLCRKSLFGDPASQRSVSARVLVGPQIISNQLRPICRMASGCHVCISLRSFTSAAQDTTFPIRSTPTLLHRFPAQMNGRIVIALPLSND